LQDGCNQIKDLESYSNLWEFLYAILYMPKLDMLAYLHTVFEKKLLSTHPGALKHKEPWCIT